jgi:D-hydroxyproline dehydrogenase subunit beta
VDSPDVLVIGAGAVGTATAYELAKTGARVLVLEQAGVTSGSTGASEGMVHSFAKRPLGLETTLGIESFAMYPRLADELGMEFDFLPKPRIIVVDDESHLDLMERWAAKKRGAGLEEELLDKKAVHDVEPLLGDRIVGGVYTPTQGVVNPMLLARAYLGGVVRRGGAVANYEPVVRIDREGDRVVAVHSARRRFTPGLVVNAAGIGAAAVAGMVGVKIEIVPKRAHMLVSEVIPSDTFRCAVSCSRNVIAGLNPLTLQYEDNPGDEASRSAERFSGWQLSSFTSVKNGNMLFCGGFAFAGLDKSVDTRVVTAMSANIKHIVPAFGVLRIIRAWAGLEPCTSDNNLILGRPRALQNFYLAAGHGNAGVMMSSASGVVLAELITTGTCHLPAETIATADPDRFNGHA